MDRDTAGDARFHREIDAGFDGAIVDFGAAESHELFIGGNDRFAMGGRAVNDLPGDVGASDQLGDDVDFGICDHFAPIARALRFFKAGRQIERGNRAAADGGHTQAETQL